jgi:hypothetical protein
MQHQVEHWRQTQITDERAKLIFYSASIDGRLDAPKSLLSDVHRLYFRTGVSGILGSDHVEPFERVDQRVQEARSSSAVQGDREVGRISQSVAVVALSVYEGASETAYGLKQDTLLVLVILRTVQINLGRRVQLRLSGPAAVRLRRNNDLTNRTAITTTTTIEATAAMM